MVDVDCMIFVLGRTLTTTDLHDDNADAAMRMDLPMKLHSSVRAGFSRWVGYVERLKVYCRRCRRWMTRMTDAEDEREMRSGCGWGCDDSSHATASWRHDKARNWFRP
ncbi:hypothetical protein CROQUDRAFT_204205 [Cronartium quercuum f. sp. fusiforme G11]|uniref:Uncharacterized protein n=1 Tax=Cronartium quercuum f. sp. fusiforme G11 TaxID=708437 RepID=A0A9P6NF31_9BASI|nr:hypothetical protein CROQUDRAFT_204205 [Cronartium quercuum f. sp. fusiforme G11]